MSIDSQIPLSGAQQPSFAQQAGGAMQLAGAFEKQQEIQQQKKDQQLIQDALKGGANLNTPEGLASTAEKLKGKVSFNTYQTLTQASSEMKTNQAKQEEAYAKMQPELIEGQMKQYDFIAQNLQGALSTYETAKSQKGEQAALQDFEAAKKQIIQNVGSQQTPSGKPMINPQMLQQFSGMNPAQTQSALMSTKYQQDRLMNGLKIQKEQSEIDLTKERTKALKMGEQTGLDEKGLKSAGAQIASGMPSTQVLPGMSSKVGAKREAARQEAISQIMEENPGMTTTEAGIELAQRGIDYAASRAGRTQTARTVGATEANIVMASSEAKKMVAIVRDVESKMDLTQYPSINAIENAVSKGTGGEQVVKLNTALMSLINTYSRAINPKGVPTVEDKKVARDALNIALSKGQMGAGLDIMEKEMDASLASPKAARNALDRVRALGGNESKSGQSTAVPRGATPKGLPDGLKQIGHTPDDKPVWQSPDGKKYVE